MQGRIVKGIAGFYYVYTSEFGIMECKAKGAFRKDGIKPLVGDIAEVELISKGPLLGNVTDIYPRSNELIRPAVANADQALIIFALRKPEPNFVTLDKMILQYAAQGLPVLLCFNKEDLADDDFIGEVLKDYEGSGCRCFVTSAQKGHGISELKDALNGKLTVVAGPSGVGKSSIINLLLGEDVQETGDISKKLKRGKHTTRHSEIFPLSGDTFIMDTPGFGSFEVFDVKAEELAGYYKEFEAFDSCRFTPCSHTHEPECGVKCAVECGKISKRRYDDYVQIYNDLSAVRRY